VLDVRVRLLPAADRGDAWRDLDLAVRVGKDPWRSVATGVGDEPRQVRVSAPAEPGEDQVVVVRVGVDPAVRGDQARAADLAVEVALAGAAAGAEGEDPTSRPLAPQGLLALGLLACAAGVSLWATRLRRGEP
jgi:hypothetical protein